MALKKYSIWDKTSNVITPSGKVFTPDEWIAEYPIAGMNEAVVVGSAGFVNGGFFGILQQMIQMYKSSGCDFTGCSTDVECLERIEEFEDAPGEAINRQSTPEERIAAALEALEMNSLPTINDDDPDAE